MKLCINCVHFYTPFEIQITGGKEITTLRHPKYALCKAVKQPVSLVTGEPDGDPYAYCSVARESPCGVNARFYEAKDIPVTEEEEEAWQELDNSCPACKQDTLHLTLNGMHLKCDTCGYFRKPEQEPL